MARGNEREAGGTAPDGGMVPARSRKPVRRWYYILLLLPCAATLVPPFYARQQPSFGGWPFFYWWQFAWIVITAIILVVVYRLTTRGLNSGGQTGAPGGAHRERRADREEDR